MTNAAGHAGLNPYDHPRLECDVVMKGGITSGVVYPGAVTELAKPYRFRSIGGASAGAIAAAVVAAAEFRRSVRRPGDAGGFVEVGALPKTISKPVHHEPFLLSLFQPEPETRALFSVAIAFLRRGVLGGTLALVTRFWRFPLLALVVAAVTVSLSVWVGTQAAFAVAGVAAAVGIIVVGVLADVVRSVLALADNDFGLCRLGGVDKRGGEALTPWLHDEIQRIAGKKIGGRPLTFADLWGIAELPPDPSDDQRAAHHEETIRLSCTAQDREVDLQMMTTDLTHGRPLRLPVPFQPHRPRLEEAGGLLYRPDELARFFPSDVMAHLEEFGAAPSDETAAHLEREALGVAFRHFPIGPDLPVVVATRMSLSFPILISAIPLWELDYQKDGDRPPLRRVIFSDGGITSNFPVHFFDSPLPARPTFGLHLAAFELEEKPDPKDPSVSVEDPARVEGRAREAWVEVDSVFTFLLAIKDAMQNWRDNAQSLLPGFRERIVHIKLDRGEGGLNLAMRPGKIEELSRRGAYAGERLVALFDCDQPEDPSGCRWNDHRYARYRTTMSLIERYLRAFERGYTARADAVTVPFPQRIAEGRLRPPYQLANDALLRYALETTSRYVALVDEWNANDETLDDPNVPRPPSTLRAVPPV